MCGIAGVYQLSGSGPTETEKLIRTMTETLHSRGPDENGYFCNGPVALGHKRLKVIDLQGGQQPMLSGDRRYRLVFNGEIYSFQSIRRRHQNNGRKFSSNSDTECLLAELEENWADAIRNLKGMFAFACHDSVRNEMILATDPFGKKPLYYSVSGSSFIFASEPKAILKHPEVRAEVDAEGLNHYLCYEYVPAPYTIFKGIRKLNRGTYLKVNADGISIHRYALPNPEEDGAMSFEDACSRLRHGLEAAVSRRLISDVPLGVFLSGGLDSTAVLGTVRKLHPDMKIKTFSIAFDEPSFDESEHARFAARHFQTEHIEETCSIRTMLDRHEEILSYLDEPLADASFIPTYLLCEIVRKHVTVALSGDGGDELFCGYPTFEAENLAMKLEHVPDWMLKAVQSAVSRMSVSMDNLSLDFKLKQLFKGLYAPMPKRNHIWLGAFDDKERTSLLTSEYLIRESPYDLVQKSYQDAGFKGLRGLQELYFRFYMQNDILTKVDRASMANSLEVRSPLLDDDFFREMMRVPVAYKFKKGTTKKVFKQAVRGLVPDRIIDRPKKGFGIPIAEWIRKDLKANFQQVLNPKNIGKYGLFSEKYVSELMADHLSGKQNNRKQLWSLYVLQIWLKNWVS